MRMDEKGVSPVIGVILMVAITVILAAVIASFVFGLSGTVKKTYNVMITAEKVNCDTQTDTCDIKLTVRGGDLQYLAGVSIKIDGSDKTPGCGYSTPIDIGTLCTIEEEGSATTRNHVEVIGIFTDGSKQIILDTYL